jgi:hypothetical protein
MPNSEPTLQPDLIVPCEVGGGYQVGWQDDAPGPFPTRAFAAMVAAATDRRERRALPSARLAGAPGRAMIRRASMQIAATRR